jgi:hypothetical protein
LKSTSARSSPVSPSNVPACGTTACSVTVTVSNVLGAGEDARALPESLDAPRDGGEDTAATGDSDRDDGCRGGGAQREEGEPPAHRSGAPSGRRLR